MATLHKPSSAARLFLKEASRRPPTPFFISKRGPPLAALFCFPRQGEPGDVWLETPPPSQRALPSRHTFGQRPVALSVLGQRLLCALRLRLLCALRQRLLCALRQRLLSALRLRLLCALRERLLSALRLRLLCALRQRLLCALRQRLLSALRQRLVACLPSPEARGIPPPPGGRLAVCLADCGHGLLGRVVEVDCGRDGEARVLDDGLALGHVGALKPHHQ
eukprot:scaffold537_cov129-Isochrysis_galbana.AAC.1